MCAILILTTIYILSPARCTGSWNAPLEYEDVFSNYEEFQYGQNRYGQIIFLHPKQAKNKIIELSSEILTKIKTEFDLGYNADSLESLNAYLSYGDQADRFSEEEERQVGILGIAVSIYEHSTWSFYTKEEIFHLNR